MFTAHRLLESAGQARLCAGLTAVAHSLPGSSLPAGKARLPEFLSPLHALYFPPALLGWDWQMPDQFCPRNGGEQRMAVFSPPLPWGP